MKLAMIADNDKLPIMRQPEQPEFFDLLNTDQMSGKKPTQGSQVITLEPLDIKLTVKFYCCPCPEDDCCHKKSKESDKCGECENTCECKTCDSCSYSLFSCDWLQRLLCLKKSSTDAPVKEEEKTPEGP